MTTSVETDTNPPEDSGRLSLSTAAARNLATTTKSVPQMQGITSRWLLRMLPWVNVPGGSYRVNRRLMHTLGDGRVEFVSTGAEVRVIPAELGELPLLRGFADSSVLEALAGRFAQHEYQPGDVLVEAGQPADRVVLIAHGKLEQVREGEYGDLAVVGVLADGGYFGDDALASPEEVAWDATVRALTPCTVLSLPRQDFLRAVDGSPQLRAHIEAFRDRSLRPTNEHGESSIDIASGHTGEPALPGVFADYELSPREFELSVAQTVLRVHTRVADLYNEPMNQVEQQLRLTVEALRERQEHEMVNNREFGLLHNADLGQRIHTRSGPPTPDDLDELLATVWKDPAFLLAHPRTIAAVGREFNRQGVYPDSVQIGEHHVPAWRGIPLFPCNKIPVSDRGTSSILLMRTGEDSQGVIGLHRTGIPDEFQPSLSVRFMGISEQAVISYLVSAYYSAAVLVPDALGILENVEIGH
ncbi:family 2B encapsulin nanocompartment shell protein [Streptomyces gamaensis]|uniref:Family 2B encapsulin nanocompartment shell protein n=1 Tax=Streptomyces gamaensis TaxID=1763542 RepID=A0ABW0Z1A7_9ACTN